MQLELYFYNECGFSQSVLNTITNLHLTDQIVMKNIRENPDYKEELIELCGDSQVPTLTVEGQPMRDAESINRFLVDQFVA